MSRPSPLAGKQIIVARDMAMQAAFLGVHNEPAIHYTQGPQRWSGINGNKKAWRGQFPNYADCSAFVTWCLWQGLDHYHVRDVVNGLNWKAGYTGSMLEHGEVITKGHQLQRGDAVIYGPATNGTHTAIYVGGGKVISHGSEHGPNLCSINLGLPIKSIRRYI